MYKHQKRNQSLFKVLFGMQCTQMFNGHEFRKITAPNQDEQFLNVSS